MLTVSTLGQFRMISDAGEIEAKDLHSPMVTKLVLYLLTHRKQPVTKEELAGALWEEDEISNPIGALKNLMYRFRRIEKSQMNQEPLILTHQGAYGWNPRVLPLVDIEEMERMYENAKAVEKAEEKERYFKQVIALYQGKFAPGLWDGYWISSMMTFYHSIFLSSVKGLSQLLTAQFRYEELECLCNHALQFENAEEQIYYYLILARKKSQKPMLARLTWEQACNILERELGIYHPAQLEELIKQED